MTTTAVAGIFGQSTAWWLSTIFAIFLSLSDVVSCFVVLPILFSPFMKTPREIIRGQLFLTPVCLELKDFHLKEMGEELISSIGRGLCVLVGITHTDTEKDAEYLCRKLLSLRLFEDTSSGKRWQKSVLDEKLEILCVSQFTLYHRLKGNKPDFHLAMQGEQAQQLYQSFLKRLGQSYDTTKVKDGKFGAYMQVHIQNDGPVTIELESPVVEAKTKTNKESSQAVENHDGVNIDCNVEK